MVQVTDSEESDVDGDLAEMGSDTADNDVNYRDLGQNDPQLEEQSHALLIRRESHRHLKHRPCFFQHEIQSNDPTLPSTKHEIVEDQLQPV